MKTFDIYTNSQIVTLELYKNNPKDLSITISHMIDAAYSLFFIYKLNLILPIVDSKIRQLVEQEILKIMSRDFWERTVKVSSSVAVPTFEDSHGNLVLEFKGAYV